MQAEYTTIKVKKEVVAKLKNAAKLINKNSKYTNKMTIAGLVAQLAESYDTQMDEDSVAGNGEDWILNGVPVILDSDAARHFRELKMYYPVECSTIVSKYIRDTATNKRFEKIA